MSQIEYINITKDYGEGSKVLDDVSFKVDKGEFVFLVGPSGAGKSTLIKLLIREETPSQGSVIFSPKSVNSIVDEDEFVNIFELPREKLPGLRRKIGVVFQDFKVLKSKNVFENVAIAMEVGGSTDAEIREVVPNVLGLVGLSHKIASFPNQLSGGEIQRLSIARALAHEPDVLVADEPTGMIDPDATWEVLNILEKINSLGTTILMATHDYKVVDALKKRVLRMEKGKLVSDKSEGKYNG